MNGQSTSPDRRSAELSDAILSALIDAAVDAIITIDRNGLIAGFNPAASRMFGHAPDEVLGRNVSCLMPEPFQSHHDGYLQRYLSTGERRIIGIGREVQGQRRDGTTFPIHLSVGEAPVGSERYFLGIIRDITALKDAERAKTELIGELAAKNAELERFTYTVSHDLKSPLITIKGFLGMIKADIASGRGERASADLDRIDAAAEKMKQLLDELLELSRIGRIVNPPEDIPLSDLGDEVKSLLEGPLAEQGVEFTVAPGLPTVHGDRVRLREVLQNLVENGIKFAGEGRGAHVELGASLQGDRVLCHVRDDGIGIDPRYTERIFGLFEQLDQSRPGTGVGLALVKRIVEVHGGRVWVESPGLGHGATFFVELPAGKTP